jgi:hypothetical protein
MPSRTSLPFAVLLLAGCATYAPPGTAPAGASATAGHAPVVGTWRIARYQRWDAQGRVGTPYGDPTSGLVVFDAAGRASVQMMRTPPVRPFATPYEPTPEEARDAYHAYVGYYGTYTVDEAARVLTVRAEGSSWPAYTGTDQKRPFRLAGDTLFLGVPGRYQATLVRVR